MFLKSLPRRRRQIQNRSPLSDELLNDILTVALKRFPAITSAELTNVKFIFTKSRRKFATGLCTDFYGNEDSVPHKVINVCIFNPYLMIDGDNLRTNLIAVYNTIVHELTHLSDLITGEVFRHHFVGFGGYRMKLAHCARPQEIRAKARAREIIDTLTDEENSILARLGNEWEPLVYRDSDGSVPLKKLT